MSLFAFLVTQSLNALSQAALLFFLGAGLTLIFGIMRIVNFAHGTFYMLGAFIGYSSARLTGSFWAALVLAPLAVGAVGMLFELRRERNQRQVPRRCRSTSRRRSDRGSKGCARAATADRRTGRRWRIHGPRACRAIPRRRLRVVR
jgi:branched-subunit amino acid transport system permease